jgi:peptidoglycan lytic transglycosylase
VGGARLLGAALLACVLAAGCAHQPALPPEPAPQVPPGPRADGDEAGPPGTQVGVASFYAHRFHGRRTASGVRYDMHEMTCAHPTHPFGTRLRVTDLTSGRSVVVTVTDRGPFTGGRIVDVSYAAAKKLGIVKRGVARVRVERL